MSGGASATGGASAKSSEGNPIIVVPNAMTSVVTIINAGFFLVKDAIFVPRHQALHNPLAGKQGRTITLTQKLNQRLSGAKIMDNVINNPMTQLKKGE